ncbi:hypothetical protein ALC62_05489, partial [Cyphomyrmex costatus]
IRRSERFKPAADCARSRSIPRGGRREKRLRPNDIHDRSTNAGLDSIEIVRGHVLLCRCLSAYRYFISRR